MNSAHTEQSAPATLFDFTVEGANGEPRDLAEFAGKVTLVVNTASECGFTPQYEGLQELQDRFEEQGFSVLAFPCNQFGNQEPGSMDEIIDFCETRFRTSFPVFAKVEVNGKGADPLFTWLENQRGGMLGGRIAWNFTKFLVGRDGHVIRRFAPPIPPARIATSITKALAA